MITIFVALVSQPVLSQLAAVPAWVSHPEAWYDSLIGIENSGLINGKRHQLHAMGRETHPFFGSKKPFSGTIFYRGQLYQNVPLLYDIYQDILIYYYRGKNQVPVMIELEARDVEYFVISEHKFERIKDQKWMNEAIGQGYIEVLFEGDMVSLMAKRQKLDYATKSSREFSDETWYYVRFLNRISPVSNQKQLGSLLPNYRSEISRYAKQNGLKIRSGKENDFILLVEFCDSLVSQQEK